MIEKCLKCLHKNVCILKSHIVTDCVSDFFEESHVYDTKYALYETVYIIDRFDVDNDCSQIGDGSGSNNIELRIRECFISQISIFDKSGNCLYWVQPKTLTTFEHNGLKHHYWEGAKYFTELFKSEEDALTYLNTHKKENKT